MHALYTATTRLDLTALTPTWHRFHSRRVQMMQSKSVWCYRNLIIIPRTVRAEALSDDARLTSVCRVLSREQEA